MIMRSNILLTLIVAVVGASVFALRAPEHGCPGSHPAMTNMTIVYNPAGIHVSPPLANGHKGGVLRFNLFGAFGTNVSVMGKPGTLPDPSWISGSGSNLKFYVCVPPEQGDGYYRYNVVVDGIGVLDPIVRILN